MIAASSFKAIPACAVGHSFDLSGGTKDQCDKSCLWSTIGRFILSLLTYLVSQCSRPLLVSLPRHLVLIPLPGGTLTYEYNIWVKTCKHSLVASSGMQYVSFGTITALLIFDHRSIFYLSRRATKQRLDERLTGHPNHIS